MRALAKAHPDVQFGHYANLQHQGQLKPLVEDLPNLKLLDTCPDGAVQTWRGADNFWYLHAERNQFVQFHLDWFWSLAKKLGFESPFTKAEDLQFDYPAMAPAPGTDHFQHPVFDFLLINSIPHSGQFRGYNQHEFRAMAEAMGTQLSFVLCQVKML